MCIMTIMSHCLHGSPLPSLATRFYCASFLGAIPGYILYQHRAIVYRSLLVFQPLLVHVKGVYRSISLMSSTLFLQ